MKKLLFLGVFIFSFFFFSPSFISAQTCETVGVRCAECDACGYCRGREAPGNWKSCAKCLYPSIAPGTDPSADQTLIVQGTIGEKARAITPALGKYYTQLGCIDTNMETFTNPSAAGGVLNFVLNRLIFPVVGVLAFLSLIYGAFLLATAQRNPEQIARGKSYVVGAIVGLLFVIGVLFIVGFIASDILKIPGFSKGSELKIYAASDFTQTASGTKTYPIMQVFLNDELKNSFTVITESRNDFKEYAIILPSELPPSKVIKVRFSNDYCPRCKGNPNGDTGDRNLHIQKITLNKTPCNPSVYFHEVDNATEPSSFPETMPYKGYILCTVN